MRTSNDWHRDLELKECYMRELFLRLEPFENGRRTLRDEIVNIINANNIPLFMVN